MKRNWLFRISLLALFLAASVPAVSQNCALCYTQAAQSTARFIQALRSGILILIIPPMFMSVGFTVMAYRKRNRYHVERAERNGGW
ncbi:MAG TPA: hypothetical protein VF011_21615 [Terriglobales bacterium]